MTRLQTSLHDYQTLTGLVEHYSPTGDTAQAADWFVQRMKSLGFTHSFVDGFGNPTGVMGAGAKQIVLLGHIDTVPGKIAVEVRENLLYGRGSVDAKGPLAAFADAVAAVGEHDNWQLVVIGAIDEEGQSQAARFLVDQYQPLYTIIGEPSDWRRITIGYKGSAHATIKISQPVSHSAGQEIGSCEKAFQVWQSILDWVNSYNQQRPRAFEQVTPALLGMHSGSDGFVEWAQIEIGTRLPIQVSPQDWKQRLIELTRDRDVEFSFAEEPISAHLADKNTPLVRAFLHAIRAQSERPGFVVKTGTADMNIVAPVWRGPILAYGPGDSTLDHTPDEHIDLNEYGRAVAVLQEALAHLMQ
jgi:LysW-gamma-L-lysine carboxypeptidase